MVVVWVTRGVGLRCGHAVRWVLVRSGRSDIDCLVAGADPRTPSPGVLLLVLAELLGVLAELLDGRSRVGGMWEQSIRFFGRAAPRPERR